MTLASEEPLGDALPRTVCFLGAASQGAEASLPSQMNMESKTGMPPKEIILNIHSVAFCSPAKSLTFSGLMENPLVDEKLKS